MKNRGYGIFGAAIAVGALSGLICVAFRYTIGAIGALRPVLYNHNNPIATHLVVFSAIFSALLITGWLVEKFPKISGSGLPQTRALLFGRRIYNRPFTYLVIKFMGGLLSLCSGLSLGREGTSVQMGSLTGYIAADLFKVPEGKRRHLIAAGAGAGVSAAFTAPLSSSILVMESLQKITITTTLICTLLAGGVAGIIAKFIVPTNIYDLIPVAAPQSFGWRQLAIFAAMALLFAIAGKLFSAMLIKGKAHITAARNRAPQKYRLLKQTFILASITWITGLFFTDMIGGDQTFLVKESTALPSGNPLADIASLAGATAVAAAFTVISHSSGYPGGIFLPMMTIGGLLGKLFYQMVLLLHNCTPGWWSLGEGWVCEGLSGYYIFIGMSAFFIAVMRTPITGFILISEMTGHYETFFPTLIVGILVYFLTHLMRVVPLNNLLYDFMIRHEEQKPARSIIYVNVGEGAYLHNKLCRQVILPAGCRIVKLYRNKKEIPIGPLLKIEADDSMGIEVYSTDIEQLYRALISFGEAGNSV